jgi:hypothetical protein
MFERVGSIAERVATDVSRREFLGRLGRGALGLAAVIGGMLAFPSQAPAGASKGGAICCLYVLGRGGPVRCKKGGCSPGTIGSQVACADYPAVCPQ